MTAPKEYHGIAIGLTGRKRAGKTTVVEVLRDAGFQIRSTRDAVMRYIAEDKSRGDPNDTKNQQYWGNEARRINGRDVWMAMLLEAPIIGDTNVVFDSPRYPDQDRTLRDYFGRKYMLMAVDAALRRRLTWTLESNRPGDPRNQQEFLEADRRDWNGYKTGDGQNVEGCFDLADIRVQNDGTIEELRTNVLKVVADFRRRVYS